MPSSSDDAEVTFKFFPLIAGVLWGTAFPAIQLALESFTPLQIAVVRAGVSAVLLACIMYVWRREALTFPRKHLPALAVMGVFGVGGFYLGQVFGVRYSTVINVSFVSMTYPVFASVLSPFLLDESLDRTDVIGLTFALLGTYVIVGNGRLIPLFNSGTLPGDVLALLGSLSMTVYLLTNGRVSNRLDIDQLTVTLYMLLFAIPVLVAPLAYVGQFSVGAVSPVALGALAWLAIVVTAGGYVSLNLGLSVETTAVAALRLLVVPLVATIISVFLLNEVITPVKVVGGLAILLGIAYPSLVPWLRQRQAT